MCLCVCACRKHYKEYLVSLINDQSLDPALLYDAQELQRVCKRHQVDMERGEGEDDNAFHARLLKVRRCRFDAVNAPTLTQTLEEDPSHRRVLSPLV